MKQRWITKKGNRRVILLFAGWGMDYRPFLKLEKPGYDLMVVWDYRDDSFDADSLKGYQEECLLAWSFGVFAASRILNSLDLPITLKAAINGTPRPIDDRQGIPLKVFKGTLENLDRENLRKFYRRICISKEQFDRFMADPPQRETEQLKQELERFLRLSARPMEPADWDMAVISECDAIFPLQNQLRAWQGHPRVILLQEQGHLPFWQQLIERILVDKGLVARRFAKSATTYHGSATVQRSIASRLWGLWKNHLDNPYRALDLLEIGYGTGFLTRLYADVLPIASLRLWDLAPLRLEGLPQGAVTECRDGETSLRLLPSESIDAIASASTVQWFNSPALFLKEALRVLRPGGVLALSTFAPGTLCEISRITGRSLNYYSKKEWQRIIPEGLEILAVEEEEIVKSFDTPMQALRHLKETGTNSLGGTNAEAGTIGKLLRDYPLAPSGKASLTYKPIYIISRKRQKNA